MDLIRHISSFCKKYSVLLAVALIAFCATKSFAQTTSAPVQVNSQLTPPYSIYLSDYTNDALNKWPITLNLRDFTKSDYRVRLRITIESQTVRFRTKPSFMPQGMYLTPGVPTQVTYDKLAAYLNPNNMEMSGINPATFANSQQLPEGFYTFNIEVLDYQRGNVVSNTSRNIAWIVQNEPPLLNLPFEEKVRIQDPQQIQFQWTPRHTSSPNSAFETEYIFRLWEIWPAGRNPFEVVRTSNPVFEQRTNLNSYFYGPGDIPLIPGRSYAWQVQAVSNIGRDLFKNNGRSEVKSFQYGDECLTVTGVGLEALGPDRIKVDWTGDWNHSGYVVEVREKGTTDWTTYATNIETQVVFDLEAGTEYEVQVKSTCGVLTGVASDIISVSTLDASEIDFECGADPDNPAITNRDPIESLQIGDRIEALGFKVRITEITGAGPYNGKGAIEVPLFNLASVEADLVNIEVNTDRKLIGGYVETTLNPAGPFIVGLDSDELDEGNGGADGDNVEDTPDTDIKVDEVISDVDVDEETGVITVTTEDGETTTIDPNEEGVDENGDGVVVVEDSNGDTWVVGPDGNVSQGQNTGGPSNPNTLPSDANVDFIVNFEKSDQQQYGFDTKSLETLTSNYTQTQIRDNDYWIPWKSVASGRTDKVLAKQSAGNSFNNAIGFKSISGNLPITASAEDLAKNVTVQGTTHKDTQLVQAYVLKENQNEAGETTEDEIILGELNVVSYDKVAQKVIIVPVNGASAPAASTLSADLNRIYGQAVAEWELVMADNYTSEMSLAGLDNEGSTMLSSYSSAMNDFKREYKRNNSIDRDAYYVFLMTGTGSNRSGYMPFKKQWGYIFIDNTSDLSKTIAHELGHGAYRLRHTFSEEAFVANQGSTDNLMDYNNGITLYKHQWDLVHDPESVNTLFEDDSESAMQQSFNLQAFIDEIRNIYSQESSNKIIDLANFVNIPESGQRFSLEVDRKISIHEDEIGIFLRTYPNNKDLNKVDLGNYELEDYPTRLVSWNHQSHPAKKLIFENQNKNQLAEEFPYSPNSHIGIEFIVKDSDKDKFLNYIFNRDVTNEPQNLYENTFVVYKDDANIREKTDPYNLIKPDQFLEQGIFVNIVSNLTDGDNARVLVSPLSENGDYCTWIGNLKEIKSVTDIRNYKLTKAIETSLRPYSQEVKQMVSRSEVFRISHECGDYRLIGKLEGGTFIEMGWVKENLIRFDLNSLNNEEFIVKYEESSEQAVEDITEDWNTDQAACNMCVRAAIHSLTGDAVLYPKTGSSLTILDEGEQIYGEVTSNGGNAQGIINNLGDGTLDDYFEEIIKTTSETYSQYWERLQKLVTNNKEIIVGSYDPGHVFMIVPGELYDVVDNTERERSGLHYSDTNVDLGDRWGGSFARRDLLKVLRIMDCGAGVKFSEGPMYGVMDAKPMIGQKPDRIVKFYKYIK